MEQFNLEEYKKNPNRKVVTRDGREVSIERTDLRGHFPILAIISNNSKDYDIPMTYNNKGKNIDTECEGIADLFFADEEEKLTEFEKKIQTIISDASHWTSDDGSISTYCYFGDKEIKKISAQIINLAREEIIKEVEQKAINHTYAYQNGYENGKYDALKKLPKLEKTKDVIDPTIPLTYTNAASMKTYVEYNGYKLCINDVFEKLPKKE